MKYSFIDVKKIDTEKLKKEPDWYPNLNPNPNPNPNPIPNPDPPTLTRSDLFKGSRFYDERRADVFKGWKKKSDVERVVMTRGVQKVLKV